MFEFETGIKGVSYKFRGRFISICVAEDRNRPKSVVAEGRIAGFKNDGEEATAQVQYAYLKSRNRAPEEQRWALNELWKDKTNCWLLVVAFASLPHKRDGPESALPHDAGDIIAFVELLAGLVFCEDAIKVWLSQPRR